MQGVCQNCGIIHESWMEIGVEEARQMDVTYINVQGRRMTKTVTGAMRFWSCNECGKVHIIKQPGELRKLRQRAQKIINVDRYTTEDEA